MIKNWLNPKIMRTLINFKSVKNLAKYKNIKNLLRFKSIKISIKFKKLIRNLIKFEISKKPCFLISDIRLVFTKLK